MQKIQEAEKVVAEEGESCMNMLYDALSAYEHMTGKSYYGDEDDTPCEHLITTFTKTAEGEEMERCACGMVAIEQEDGTWKEVC